MSNPIVKPTRKTRAAGAGPAAKTAAADRARKSAKKPAVAASPVVTDSMIAGRAYDLYLARGGQHGHDVDDWLRAEGELRR